MNILITGSSGYIGRNLIPKLIQLKYRVFVLTRDPKTIEKYRWIKDVTILKKNFYYEPITEFKYILKKIDFFIHLSWQNLPNYESPTHIDDCLPREVFFINQILNYDIKKIIITGTCLEYGLKNGAMKETSNVFPILPYAVAKNNLRLFIQEKIKNKKNIKLAWLRLFYVYGHDQPKRFILPKLQEAIKRNNTSFHMSDGRQVRDFIHIDAVISKICLVVNKNIFGIINISSGTPQSLFDFISNKRKEFDSDIYIVRGYFDRSKKEPESFWGVTAYF